MESIQPKKRHTPRRRQRFTRDFLSSLKPTAKREYYYDDKEPKLGATLHPTGRITFFVRITKDGSTKRYTIENGEFPSMTVDTARGEVPKVVTRVSAGEDPTEAKRKRKTQEALHSLTVEDAVDIFCEGKERRLSTGEKVALKEGTKSSYRKTIKALLGETLYKGPLVKLTEATIEKCVSKCAKSVGATGCRSLSSVWNWTNKQQKYRGKLPPNPVKEYASYNDGLHKSAPKDRRLPQKDFPAFLAEVSKLKSVQQQSVLWLLLTGNRSGEAEGLEWTDIDWKHNEYTLRDPKNRRAATLPIPSSLVQPLRLRRATEGRVFPVTIRKHVETCADAVGLDLSPHDLRRTHAGLCASVLPEVSSKRLQNRVLIDVFHQYVGTTADLHEELAKVERTFYALAEQPLENVTHLESVK